MSYLLITPITPANLATLNPNPNQQAPDATSFFPLVDAYRVVGLKDFLSEKPDAVVLQQIKERGALPMIDRGDICQQSTVAAISGLHCRALVMVSSDSWQPDCKIQRSGRNGQRDWCMSRVTAIIPAWLSASSPACHGLLIITVITPLPTKPSAIKMLENWKLANAAITDMMRQRDVAGAWCKIHEGVSWC